MARVLAAALLTACLAPLASCAPRVQTGPPLTRAELQSTLPGRVSDFGNGTLITWNTDGTFRYDDLMDNSGSINSRTGAKWGPGGTYQLADGQVCMRFPGVVRCDGMSRGPGGGLVATVLDWPYAVTLR